MNAKNGELAIARFDDEEKVCFVTGRDKSQTKFVYWDYFANGTNMYADSLPKGRVVSAAPKPGNELLFLGGEFYKLTIDDVVPANAENMAALCLSIEVETSKVKLGGCYHSGKTYCLGYRNGYYGEVELDTELFTGLSGGVKGGAETALRSHRENFNPSEDITRFIVELAAVRIIDEVTEDTYSIEKDPGSFANSHPVCDDCCNSEEKCTCDDMCEECHGFDCACDEENDDYCDGCGYSDGECDCDDESSGEEYCLECDEKDDDCLCCEDDDLDDENVDQTFSTMNAFARARWLSAQRK